MLQTTRRSAGPLALLLTLVACGGGAGPGASAAALPDGWERVTAAEAGFSMALPDGWDELTSDDLGDDQFDALESANPESAAILEQAQQAMQSGQIAFFAFDLEPTDASSTFAANVNVIDSSEVRGSATEVADELASQIRDQLPINGEVETETASLPAGETAIVRYEWTVASADGSSNDVTVTQYLILGDDGGYIISFSAATPTMAEYGATFRSMAESFQEE